MRSASAGEEADPGPSWFPSVREVVVLGVPNPRSRGGEVPDWATAFVGPGEGGGVMSETAPSACSHGESGSSASDSWRAPVSVNPRGVGGVLVPKAEGLAGESSDQVGRLGVRG